MKCPKCKGLWLDTQGDDIVCHKCGSYWELQKRNLRDNTPKCPQCDTEIRTIFPQADKRLCDFDCGHTILKEEYRKKGIEDE